MSTLLQMVIPDAPQNLIGDNAYDSDRLDAELRVWFWVAVGIALRQSVPVQCWRVYIHYARIGVLQSPQHSTSSYVRSSGT